MKTNKPEADTSIHNRLLEIRKAKGLTQGEFADRIKIGRSMIGSIEEGRRVVKDRFISLVCMTFEANEHWIRTGKVSAEVPGTIFGIPPYTGHQRRRLSTMIRLFAMVKGRAPFLWTVFTVTKKYILWRVMQYHQASATVGEHKPIS